MKFDYHGKKILIVEDDEQMQEIDKLIFETFGINVEFAGNGQEAIDISRNNVYDLILMDIQMPEINGIDATKHIRSFNKNTPIVMLSIFSEENIIKRSLSAGANDFISKPFTLAQIEASLKKYLLNNKQNSILS